MHLNPPARSDPDPGRRMRSEITVSGDSGLTGRIVGLDKPVARVTTEIPPYPSMSASLVRRKRRRSLLKEGPTEPIVLLPYLFFDVQCLLPHQISPSVFLYTRKLYFHRIRL